MPKIFPNTTNQALVIGITAGSAIFSDNDDNKSQYGNWSNYNSIFKFEDYAKLLSNKGLVNTESEIVERFANKIIFESVDLEPEIVNLIEENFWELF